MSALLEPFLCLLLASSAVSPGPPLPSACHIEGVSLAARTPDWCGPAALAAVLAYWGDVATPEQIAQDIYLPDYRGSVNLDLLIFARKRGLDAWAGEGTADELRRALSRGRPVICMVRRRSPLAARNHFVVLRGYDQPKGIWFVDSGDGREERIAHDDFDREWRDAGCWMLVIEGPRPAQANNPAERQEAHAQ